MRQRAMGYCNTLKYKNVARMQIHNQSIKYF